MTVLIFSALVWKVIDFFRMCFNFKTQKSGIITQVTAWAGGVLLVVLAAHAGVTSSLILPGSDKALGSIDFASQILLGLLISSVASSVVDIKQAIDGTDSASKPSISLPSISFGASTPQVDSTLNVVPPIASEVPPTPPVS